MHLVAHKRWSNNPKLPNPKHYLVPVKMRKGDGVEKQGEQPKSIADVEHRYFK